jgi:hypothetical protein
MATPSSGPQELNHVRPSRPRLLLGSASPNSFPLPGPGRAAPGRRRCETEAPESPDECMPESARPSSSPGPSRIPPVDRCGWPCRVPMVGTRPAKRPPADQGGSHGHAHPARSVGPRLPHHPDYRRSGADRRSRCCRASLGRPTSRSSPRPLRRGGDDGRPSGRHVEDRCLAGNAHRGDRASYPASAPRRHCLLLVLADVAFGLVKVVVYHESVHAILVVDLALLGAWTPARRLGVAEDSLTWSA